MESSLSRTEEERSLELQYDRIREKKEEGVVATWAKRKRERETERAIAEAHRRRLCHSTRRSTHHAELGAVKSDHGRRMDAALVYIPSIQATRGDSLLSVLDDYSSPQRNGARPSTHVCNKNIYTSMCHEI